MTQDRHARAVEHVEAGCPAGHAHHQGEGRSGDQRTGALDFSLTTGPGGMRFSDGEVQCPWHNSRFDLCTGENRDWAPGFAGRNMPRWSHRLIALGRRPAPLTTYRVDVEGEDVFLHM